MEIHSVLGKYIRGKQSAEQKCNRQIKINTQQEECTNTWFTPKQNKLPKREARRFKQLINDIINKRNEKFNVSIIPLTENTIKIGQNLLQKYAYTQDFRSLDATIAASAKEKTNKNQDITVFTYDKKLKYVLEQEEIKVRGNL